MIKIYFVISFINPYIRLLINFLKNELPCIASEADESFFKSIITNKEIVS